jgi:ketosteroid isomerase-like protein
VLADDATFRAAGVPEGLGGVLRGREAIVEQLRRAGGESSFEVKQMFGDDGNVCVVGKVTAQRFIGSEHLRGQDQPYSTYECVVYRIAGGKVAESTTYTNWLDPYVQLGLVDVTALTR